MCCVTDTSVAIIGGDGGGTLDISYTILGIWMSFRRENSEEK
jgi:hypothetical protein